MPFASLILSLVLGLLWHLLLVNNLWSLAFGLISVWISWSWVLTKWMEREILGRHLQLPLKLLSDHWDLFFSWIFSQVNNLWFLDFCGKICGEPDYIIWPNNMAYGLKVKLQDTSHLPPLLLLQLLSCWEAFLHMALSHTGAAACVSSKKSSTRTNVCRSVNDLNLTFKKRHNE